MSELGKYAIITPYYKEERTIIERCMASVRRQTVPTDHFLVADGFPQDWVDTTGVRHLKLDRSHGDFGNTPRGMGALIAIAEEYSGIGFLDADNWLEPDHVEACLAAASASPATCDYVIAQRTFRRLDESIISIADEPLLVDTNCYFMLRGAFCAIPHWAMMPRQMSPAGDRVFYSMLLRQEFVAARVSRPTVNYTTMWKFHYHTLRETPPPDAKPGINHAKLKDWFESLPPREHVIATRLMGWSVSSPEARPVAPSAAQGRGSAGPTEATRREAKIGRNDKCPCGSGRKYKHCHGTSAR